ncbi:MAG TPA: hydroxymethylbilane synthase [candidate division Zixibacteria bacterium]|nr:hydroxymethylbilane synthase [candidate division Zixibacteria bacterium]
MLTRSLPSTIRIGTRRSRLALAQARLAAAALRGIVPDTAIVPIATTGDAISRRQPRGGWEQTDGQFTRDIERALLEGRIDLAVHSFKDLPIAGVEGLLIAAVLPRADPRDCLITRDGGSIDRLPVGARVGTSSPRRAAQLRDARPDLRPMPIRGNLDTRLRRLRAGEYDAVLLAAAGLDRLGIATPQHARLPLEVCLPAPAQGALALQVRADDDALVERLAAVDHPPTRVAVQAERRLLRRVGGGCLAPLGALAELSGEELRLRAACDVGDGRIVRAEARGAADRPDSVIERVAVEILGP